MTTTEIADPGELPLTMADCSRVWTPLETADQTCIPYARTSDAGFIFPLADDPGDGTPIPIDRLLYANRAEDIAIFQVDGAAVEARGVRPARLSMIPNPAEYPVVVVGRDADSFAALPSTLQTGTPALLPAGDPLRLIGPWLVQSLVLSRGDALEGSPVFSAETGDMLGLVWRSSEDGAQSWVTPAAIWYHDLWAANDEIHSDALSAVLNHATVGPVDGLPTLNDPEAPNLGNSGIDVQHYTLTLDLDPSAGKLSGTAALDIRATYHQLYSFSLDSRDLEIDSVTIDEVAAPFVAKESKLIIQLAEAVPYGTTFQVIVAYHAMPQPFTSAFLPYFSLGMFVQDGHIFTLNEPDAAHTWFPCNDHPSDRATYDFYLTVPQPLEAVSNGRLLEMSPLATNARTFHWQMAYPMATYLALAAVGDYDVIEETTPAGILIRNYVYPDQVEQGRTVFSYTDDAIALFEPYFGPYPFDSYGHVVTPQQGSALETQTMTAMPDSILASDEASSFAIVVHELAHQWFGDAVTVGSWADIWLNESFATYAEWLAQETRYGSGAAVAARTYSEQSLISDNRMTPLNAPAQGELFGTSTYEKGAWLLHMLRLKIGDDAFFSLLRAYVSTYHDRPASSLDFWRLAEEISGQDLAPFFYQWLLQGGIPRYTLYWSATDSGADVLLCPQSPNFYMLDLPLVFSSSANQDTVTMEVRDVLARASFPLAFRPDTLTVDPDQAVLAQIQLQPIAALPTSCP